MRGLDRVRTVDPTLHRSGGRDTVRPGGPRSPLCLPTLLVVPLMPTFPPAALARLGQFALSQMDVPTRQAYTMALVTPEQRPRAAGLAAVRPAAAAVAPPSAGSPCRAPRSASPFILPVG